MSNLHHVGLDVHARSIVAASVQGEGRASLLFKIDHDVARLKKELAKLGAPETLRVVYEAGPTGYGLCRELRKAGFGCDVIAPSLIPKRPGDRVKTDRRDACALAELSRSGMLRAVSVPEPHQESLRDLVRARESAKSDEKKAGQRLDKFLLRYGRRPPAKVKKGSAAHTAWLKAQTFTDGALTLVFEEYLTELAHQEQRVARLDATLEAQAALLPPESQAVVRGLMALKGVAFLSAVTLVSELGDIPARFPRAKSLMSYAGVTSREYSTGESIRRGSITKCGNAHVRRIAGEAAQAHARAGSVVPCQKVLSRRKQLSASVINIAERADRRLGRRFRHLTLKRGKERNVAVTAISRELLGFVWAIAVAASKGAPAAESK